MIDTKPGGPSPRYPLIRNVLLLLALLTSPLACCGFTYLLDYLPPSLLPAISFITNLFESETRVENLSQELLLITPITTAYGYPLVIHQPGFRQRDIPLPPGASVAIIYDAADAPLNGVAVCRPGGDCAHLTPASGVGYRISRFEDLPALPPDWRQAIESQPRSSFAFILIPGLGLLPVILFGVWLYLGFKQD